MIEEDILDKYKKVLLEDIENDDPNELKNILRKQAVFGYLASTKHLPKESSAFILKENLEKYSLATSNLSVYDNVVKKKLEQSKNPSNNSFLWKSNIQNTDFQKHLEFSNEYVPSDDELQLFLNAFKTTKNNPVINNDPKPSTSHSSSGFAPNVTSNKLHINKPPEHIKEKETYGSNVFKTARQELNLQNIKKFGNSAPVIQQKRKLGIRRSASSKFVSPMLSNESSDEGPKSEEWADPIDERLKNIDPKMVELIKSEIMDSGSTVNWNDIAGLEFAKTAIQEAVVWPMLRPDIFTGLRRPPKGILLFGPPGTGKTLIGKCVASQSKSTFFSISASSLTSKWIGDGEKMVRALFAVARCHQPAVIFIDEIDSLLSQRSETEHESSRRIKTEFLVQLDGATTDNEERLLVIGATNRPQELDEAARRRLVKRLYIPLPEFDARFQLVQRLMSTERHSLTQYDLREIAKLSDGYSGADMRNLCSDACLGPIRSMDMNMIESIQATEVRPVTMDDFRKSLNRVRSSVSPKDLDQYVVWDNTYGSGF